MPVVLTIGHSSHEREEFVELLRKHEVATLIDVRRYATSRRFPHFNQRPLIERLFLEGIGYFHEPELGGMRRAVPDSPNNALDDSFRGYADHMASAGFSAAVERILSLGSRELCAVMCAEADPDKCHRRFLSDALALRGATVRHVRDHSPAVVHKLHAAVRRCDDGTLVYRATEQLGLFR